MTRHSLLFLVAFFAASSTAHADWPMQRQSPERRATGTGTSSIHRPAPAFRLYLGGSLGRDQYLTADVDGNGRIEVLLITGGALVAKTPNDALVWETGALDLFRLDGFVDLDGDGVDELVATARAGRVHVFRVRDGEVLWSLPSGVVGNVGAVRFADFDGDGRPDLYVADQACGSTGSLGDVGRVYRFAAGFGAPTVHFELERGRRDYVCGTNDTLVDLDGDGHPEVVAQGRFRFYVYSGVDGSLLSESPDIGSIPYGQATVRLVDVDGDGRLELVCFTENSYAPPVNSRRVFLMAWDETEGRLERQWERSVVDLRDDRHGFAPASVEDLGGDGRAEVVTSFYDAAADRWRTEVIDARDGEVIATLDRGPFRGLVDLDGDGSSELLVGGQASGLGAFRFVGTGFERLFIAPRTEPVYVRDLAAGRLSSPNVRPLALDLGGTGQPRLLAVRYSDDEPTAFVALDASTDPPTDYRALPYDDGVTIGATEVFANVTRAYPQILAVRSDGFLWVLDDRLQPTNAEAREGEFPERGLRTGGYYSGPSSIASVPIATDFDGDGASEIVVRDGRGRILRLNVGAANLVEPPAIAWARRGGIPIAVDLDGDGTPEVVFPRGPSPDDVVALRADGTLFWQRTVGGPTTTQSYDLVPVDANADGVPDLVYQRFDSSGGDMVLNVLDSRDGAPLWPADYRIVVAGSGHGTSAIGRTAGGELALLASPRNLLVWLSLTSGEPLGQVLAGYVRAPIFVDVDGVAGDEILTSGGVHGVYALEPSLDVIWSQTEGRHTSILGAPVTCPSGVRFFQGHTNSARLTGWRASDGSVVADLALRGGRVYEPASSAPEGPGVLGNVTVSPDLTGAGRPSILVPSTDGHLYALDPCTLALDWALDFRRPVGEAILADTDGDGEDEIVVTVADGYLYGIGRERVPAPEWVRENDGSGPALSPEDDVDELVTRSRLWANWASVPEATGYEVALLTPGGAFVTSPPFIDVGDATEVELNELPLRIGQRYFFAVRAISAEGASSESLSNGVTVLSDPCDACGPAQRCVEGRCEADPCSGVACPGRCEEGVCIDVPAPDAGPPAPAVDGGMPPASQPGGCCTVAPGAPAPFALGGSALGLLGILLGLRRRRRR